MDRNLRAFLAVARTGNLTVAADKIGLTQPALTKTIRRLELDFKAKLFDRTPRGMLLTDVGTMLFERAGLIEMHYKQAQEEIAAHEAGMPLEFRIAAGSAYHSAIAPDLVRRLGHEFPKTRFVLAFEVAGSALPKLIDGELDLLLGAFLFPPTEGIETRSLLRVEISAYCCRDNPLANLETIAPADLQGRKWVIYQRDRLMKERLQFYCADHLLPIPQVTMEIDSLVASFRVVRGTEFLTPATTMVRPMAESVGLSLLPLKYPIWRFQSGAWFRRSMRGYPVIQRSLQLLEELVATHAPHSSQE